MKPGQVTIEIKLGVSDETAKACEVIINHHLFSHPDVGVDISTVEGVVDTLAREIHLRKEAEP